MKQFWLMHYLYIIYGINGLDSDSQKEGILIVKKELPHVIDYLRKK
jgi:hypothetical protein